MDLIEVVEATKEKNRKTCFLWKKCEGWPKSTSSKRATSTTPLVSSASATRPTEPSSTSTGPLAPWAPASSTPSTGPPSSSAAARPWHPSKRSSWSPEFTPESAITPATLPATPPLPLPLLPSLLPQNSTRSLTRRSFPSFLAPPIQTSGFLRMLWRRACDVGITAFPPSRRCSGPFPTWLR